MSVVLQVNRDLDFAAYGVAYARFGYVQIHNFLAPAAADALAQIVGALPWRLLVQDEEEKNVMLSREQLAAMSPEQLRKLESGVRERAARDVGYTYWTYPLIEAHLNGWDEGHPIHAFTQFLNSDEVLEVARSVIGEPNVIKIDGHATNFSPRHYLTRHIDEGLSGERRAAYTIGLSKDWRPDWGGLLLFFDSNDDVARGLLPRFNTLTVFDGRVPHAVSAVSSFAPRARVSIAGWFRDDAPRKGS
ncbi:MAG: 2OG-Fe(II) oxygenase [Hyphomonadaceae bacterium]|nr:2OG-Fe(II) oxygenase [Hyphomonadaceae bacterium]